jgi:hypothetical protein
VSADSAGDDLYTWNVELWRTAFKPDCQLAKVRNTLWCCVPPQPVLLLPQTLPHFTKAALCHTTCWPKRRRL